MVACPQFLCFYFTVDTHIVSEGFRVYELEGEQHLVFLERADIRVNGIGIVIEYVYLFHAVCGDKDEWRCEGSHQCHGFKTIIVNGFGVFRGFQGAIPFSVAVLLL